MTTLGTPYFLIDERRLVANLEVVRTIREVSGARSVLALKCFSTWAVFGLMGEYLDGTTSSSLYEARLGREEFGGEVHAYCVAFTADEVAALAGVADKVIFNSRSQLDRFAALVDGPELGIRVNPGISHSAFDLADPARPFSRLGLVDIDEVRAVAPRVRGLVFHFNSGEVGPFATGATTVTIRWDDLLGYVRPDGPLRSLRPS